MMEVREHREDLLQRLPVLRISFIVLLLAIASSYWFVQVVQGGYYRTLAENNRLRKLSVMAPRGLIYDRDGRVLVGNVPSYNLLLDRSRSRDVGASFDFAAQILGRAPEELEEAAERLPSGSPFAPVLIAENLSLSQVARFSVANLEHPEFEIDVGHLRLYRHGPLTAHVLGYLGEVTADDLRQAGSPYRSGDLVGKKGIEQTFDRELRGTNGERVVVVDSRGRSREEFGGRAAQAGEDVRLTLDLALQERAARYFEARVGAAVALDPRSGEIRLLVSAPSYNPNLFARRLDRSEWQQLLESPHDPLQNRALQNTYSPGSIFKIVVAVAGLSEGFTEEKDAVYCSGGARIYNRRFRCWRRQGHGWVNLREAIKKSCDVYFYYLGQKLGIDRLAEYARRFGLGQPTGVDIAGEKPGLVPDLEWSLQARGTTWYPGETISVAIGQGPLLVTPLQIASVLATTANGGSRVVPHLREMEGPARREPTGLDPRALGVVGDALWAVVNDGGTGAAARLAGFDIAGKTGTVQVVEQKTWVDSRDLPFDKRDHAWFGAFGPVEWPELVVVVFVEHGGKGSAEAAPLAKLIYEEYRNDRDTRRPS